MEWERAMMDMLASKFKNRREILSQLAEYVMVLRDLKPDIGLVAELLGQGILNPRELRREILKRLAVRGYKELMYAIEKVGEYGLVKFSDPKVAEFVELMGGWRAVCMMQEKEIRHYFFELYPALKGKDQIVGELAINQINTPLLDLKEKKLKRLGGKTNG